MKPKKTIRPEHKNSMQKYNTKHKKALAVISDRSTASGYLIVFKYMPIIGSQIAFRDYNFKGGIWHSPFVGLKYFKMFSSHHSSGD